MKPRRTKRTVGVSYILADGTTQVIGYFTYTRAVDAAQRTRKLNQEGHHYAEPNCIVRLKEWK